MTKIKFAIIGCGRIGQRHAGHINEQAELVAVCDTIEDKAKVLGFDLKYPTSITL